MKRITLGDALVVGVATVAMLAASAQTVFGATDQSKFVPIEHLILHDQQRWYPDNAVRGTDVHNTGQYWARADGRLDRIQVATVFDEDGARRVWFVIADLDASTLLYLYKPGVRIPHLGRALATHDQTI
jgi:hypothetical protein